MARGRIYVMGFQNVTVSAVQDLLAIYSGASKIFAVHEVVLGQITGTSIFNARVRLRRLPATVTSGSVGSAGTISPLAPGDAAATVTGRVNDTTQATSSGTIIDIRDDVWNTVNGYQYLPPPNDQPIVGLSQAFVVSLDTALSSWVCSGSIVLEELP